MAEPTIKQLRFLVALDDHRNFGRAATACHISQSAFSLAIKELETKLNVRLVDRTNRRMAFTEIGQAIADQARLCLGDIEVLVDLAASSMAPLSGSLKLGIIPTIAPFLLPAVLPSIHARFPDLRLYLREDKTRAIHEQLLTGRLDLILIALPFEMRGVEIMPLFDDPFFFACYRETRWLKDRPNGIDLDALPEESILLLDDGHCLRDHALHACELHQTEQISRFSATSLQTLLQMVAVDLGITFIPAMAQHSIMLQGSDIELHAMPTGSSRQIGLAWRKGSGREHEFRLFGSLIHELYRNSATP